MKIKIESKKEIKRIIKLLKANDEESRYLGYGYYLTSKFRKYIRNKTYSYKTDPTARFRFPLYSLNLIKSNDLYVESRRVSTNESTIHLVSIILEAYLQDKLIFHGKNETGYHKSK